HIPNAQLLAFTQAHSAQVLLDQGILKVLILPDMLTLWTPHSPGIPALAAAISADNLATGMAGSAFIAYLSGLTNTGYTATQYALFSSLMTLPGKFIGGFSGVVVDSFGYTSFFAYTAAAGLPAIILAAWLWSYHR